MLFSVFARMFLVQNTFGNFLEMEARPPKAPCLAGKHLVFNKVPSRSRNTPDKWIDKLQKGLKFLSFSCNVE